MAITTRVMIVTLICALGLSACGHKGKLKSPTEAAKSEQKKEK